MTASPTLEGMMAQIRDRKGATVTRTDVPSPPRTARDASQPPRVVLDATFPDDMPLESIRSELRAMTQALGRLDDELDRYRLDVNRCRDNIETTLSAIERVLAGEGPGILREEPVTTSSLVRGQLAPGETIVAATVSIVDEPRPATAGSWKCPEHRESILKTNARTGRQYLACPLCPEIERPK